MHFDVRVVLALANGSPSSGLTCPLDRTPPPFFEHLFIALHGQVFQTDFILSLPQT